MLSTALSIAFELQSDDNTLILISSDKRLNRAAKLENLEILNPEIEEKESVLAKFF